MRTVQSQLVGNSGAKVFAWHLGRLNMALQSVSPFREKMVGPHWFLVCACINLLEFPEVI